MSARSSWPAKTLQAFAAWPLWRLALIFLALHVLSLSIFAAGFLLTRIELHDRNVFHSTLLNSECEFERPVRKVVWMIIDALRWDFVIGDAAERPAAMPILLDIARAAVSTRLA